ncbi:McrBC 5-methylcytosine restriction system component-like protein [Caballeronia calidae]|uniref:McrBC 5-methylcytosine restriction system component-like protein n=1 Tax=Caballeronia calidae TaxID=1777139 RepID=A0A158DYZ1_9BURK|nr:McrBC 5-methylcytosine restriction system component-like protein [Caballeronia calidae]
MDQGRPFVSARAASRLTSLRKQYGFEVFKYANATTIAAQQYVGVLQTESEVIEVLPKITGEDDQVRRNLVGMLDVALDLDIGEADIARVGKQTHGVLELLIRLYCGKLFEQLRRGLVRRYEPREENLGFVRGRLSIADQTRKNAANPERLYCRFEEFQEDNPLNVIVKASLRMLLRNSRSPGNQRLLSELLLAFESVSDCAHASLPWSRVRFDRLNERYRPCFRLAEMFLRQTSPDVTAGSAHGFSLFFDMNVLFEEYIGRMALPVLRKRGLRGQLQGPRKYLARDMAQAKPIFAMKPDLVATDGATARLIVDTKWKRLSPEESKEGVAQSDLYQMYAYAHCYDCATILLLYPHDVQLGVEPGIRRRFRLNSTAHRTDVGARAMLGIATIDLKDLRTVPSQLDALFDAPCIALPVSAP